MFRNYIRRGVFLATAASSLYLVQEDRPIRSKVIANMYTRSRIAVADDGQPAEADLINTILKKEFASYTPEQLARINHKEAAKFRFELKSRQDHLKRLRSGEQFDLLIVGGGANGAGVVLDAASRGLNCAIIDSYDFAAGTSSKSTKMAHGGIRYFQQMCFLQGDPIESYCLLKETLNERNYFLQAAPYLVQELNLLIPCKSLFWTLFWYWPGAFGYHLIYLKELMKSNYQVLISGPKFVNKEKLRKQYPDCGALHGQYGAVMSEAQMHDSRMNLNTLFTAAIDDFIPGMKGAALANYVEFQDFLKDEHGKIVGAMCVDKMDPKSKPFPVHAKVVVNCAGVHADTIRQKDQPDLAPRIVPSRGTHLIFKKGLLKENTGIIAPETSDGRLLFVINYMGHPMVGTTDEFCEATHQCEPTEKEIDFIINEIKPYLGEDYDYKGNLLASWAGLRPLVKSLPSDNVEQESDHGIRARLSSFMQARIRWLAHRVNGKKKSSTAQISRNHVIEVNPNSNLVSLMGGKWTAYRVQGEQTVDRILQVVPELQKIVKYDSGQTLNFSLIGSYSKTETTDGLKMSNEQLFKRYEDHFVFEYNVQRDVAKHLVKTYGTTAWRVLAMGKNASLNERLAEEYPFLKSEVLFAIRCEMAQKPNDVVCRRVPVSFIDTKTTAEVILPQVVQIFAKEFGWDKQRIDAELQEAIAGLQFMK